MEYSWEALDFARWQKISGNSLSQDQVFWLSCKPLQSRIETSDPLPKRQPDASPVQFSKLVAVTEIASSKQKQI